MLEALNEFVSNNTTLVLIALVALVALVGFVLFRRSRAEGHNSGMIESPVPTPSHDLEGMDNVNMVCDLSNGVCMPPQETQEMPVQMQAQMQEAESH